MARIRLAGQQPEGVTAVEFVDVTDVVGDDERYLHEQAVPPASFVLPDDFKTATGHTPLPVVLDCRGFDSFGAGLAFIVSLWRSCAAVVRRMIFCLSEKSFTMFSVFKLQQLGPYFRELPVAVAAAKGFRERSCLCERSSSMGWSGPRSGTKSTK